MRDGSGRAGLSGWARKAFIMAIWLVHNEVIYTIYPIITATGIKNELFMKIIYSDGKEEKELTKQLNERV